MIVALILVLVAVGSVVFHFLSPWWFTPIASNWRYIDDTIIITFWITGVVFTAIVLFMAYCVFRFRHQEGTRAAYRPENKRLEWWLAIGTAVGVAAMLAPGLFVWSQFVTVPEGASEFEVVGQQWQWTFRLPGKDGRLGTSDTRNVSSDNPLGLNPNDPNGQDDVVIEGGELHLPLGQPQMRGSVVVETESDYQTWLQKQPTFAQISGPKNVKNLASREGEAASGQRGSAR